MQPIYMEGQILTSGTKKNTINAELAQWVVYWIDSPIQYWKSPISILGTSGYEIYIFLEKNG